MCANQSRWLNWESKKLFVIANPGLFSQIWTVNFLEEVSLYDLPPLLLRRLVVCILGLGKCWNFSSTVKQLWPFSVHHLLFLHKEFTLQKLRSFDMALLSFFLLHAYGFPLFSSMEIMTFFFNNIMFLHK